MGDLVNMTKDKIFTLKEAQSIIPILKRITDDAVVQLEALKQKIEEIDPEESHRQPYENEFAAITNRWSQKIQKLGCVAKGLWLVDFDNGEGYYCWKHPEEELGYFHPYEGGFSGRTPIL